QHAHAHAPGDERLGEGRAEAAPRRVAVACDDGLTVAHHVGDLLDDHGVRREPRAADADSVEAERDAGQRVAGTLADENLVPAGGAGEEADLRPARAVGGLRPEPADRGVLRERAGLEAPGDAVAVPE